MKRAAPTPPPLDIVSAMDHPRLFRPWFDGASWDRMRTVLRAADALPMTKGEIKFFKSIAGGRKPPKRRVKELWIFAGRRTGKDSIASLAGAHAGMFFDPKAAKLRRGERALVMCLATDRDQAKIVLGYMRSYFQDIPALAAMVQRQNSDGFELTNGVDVVVATNSFRAVRGRAILLPIFDEVCFWQDDRSARPDKATYDAVLPGMASLPNSMLIGISSPGKKSGLAYDKFKRHFGKDDDDVLVIRGSTKVLNPTIDPKIIAKAYQDDPAVARAEWGGEWRDDLVQFVDPEVVEACVSRGVREVMPVHRGVQYFAFADPSGGSSDSFTMAIGHLENGKVIVDCIHEKRPPFSPDQAVLEMAAMLRAYHVTSIQSDRYAGQWVTERFQTHGIRCEQSAKPKSDLYLELLPLLNARRIELLDHKRLVGQLCALERRVGRSGRDSIDHPQGGHDDLINAVAGLAAMISLGERPIVVTPELLQRVLSMPPRRQHTSGRRYAMFMPTRAQTQQPFVSPDRLEKEPTQ